MRIICTFLAVSAVVILSGCTSVCRNEAVPVASFKGIQLTGITISDEGRMFVNFPRWREGVPFSVAELRKDGSRKIYPDRATNDWEIGREVQPGRFICVQSVIAHGDKLYVLDTGNPLMRGLVATPVIYVYDLKTDLLVRTYPLADSVKKKSYTNDLRVDERNGKIYLTDSGMPGLIVLDLATGENYRVLDGSPMTTAETDYLVIGNVKWSGKVHSDGIALDRKNGILYFHALTGYTLYGIPTAQLLSRNIAEKEIFKMKTPAPDGMIMDDAGNLIMGDLENSTIVYLTPDRKEIRTLSECGDISWPDTFAIYDGFLYFTNSRIHEARGDISNMEFTVSRIKLPGR